MSVDGFLACGPGARTGKIGEPSCPGAPVAFPIEERYSPVGTQHVSRTGQNLFETEKEFGEEHLKGALIPVDGPGIQIVGSGKPGWEQTAVIVARFFQVRVEVLA
jgi:hypothetical protein